MLNKIINAKIQKMSLELYNYFFKREIQDKYLGNIMGFSWVLIQPIITLIIYWVVFDKIFKARVPEAEEVGFIVYLAIGFWPWMAFSEAVIRSITSVTEKKELIGKVNIDFKIPIIASISASFFLNLIGYMIVLMGLVIFADVFYYENLPLLIIPLLQLYVLAIALGLILSSLQVFIRDTLQFMTTIMTLWFFMTPIIYSESILPDLYKSIIQLNPLYTPINFIHNALITNKQLPWLKMIILSVVIVIILYICLKIFNKLSNSFEEYI